MTLQSVTSIVSYAGNGATIEFPITYRFLDDSHVQVSLRDDATSILTPWVKGTQYTLIGAGEDSGTLTVITTPTDYTPASGETLFIERKVPFTQLTDFVEGGPLPAEVLENGLDKNTMLAAQLSDTGSTLTKVVRAAATVTDNPDLSFIEAAAGRAGKIIGFSPDGSAIALQDGAGNFKGDWATSTSYLVRDVVISVDAATLNNNYVADESHVSGVFATDLAAGKWIKVLDAKAVADSAAAAAASEANAATSETNAATSETNAATSASNAATSETNAATSETNAATSASNAEASATILEYVFDGSTAMADPGSGDLRFNNATISSVTLCAFSNLTSGSGTPDVSDLIASFDDVPNVTGSSTITFRKAGTNGIFAKFYITLVADNSSWLQVSLTYINHSGSFSASDTIMCQVATSGNDGSNELITDITPQLGGVLDTNAKQVVYSQGADVASASALNLGSDGNYFDITGSTTITSINTLTSGFVAKSPEVRLHFDSALILTHHATNLILPGGVNIATAAGDEAKFIEYASGDWRCVSYQRASGIQVAPSDWEFIESQAVSGTPSDINMAIIGYDEYKLYMFNILPVLVAEPVIQVSTDGGTSYDETGYAYHVNGGITSSSTYSAASSTSSTFLKLSFGILTDTDFSTKLYIHGAADATKNTVFDGYGSFGVRTSQSSGYQSTRSIFNHIKFFFPGSNISSGTFILYGKKA